MMSDNHALTSFPSITRWLLVVESLPWKVAAESLGLELDKAPSWFLLAVGSFVCLVVWIWIFVYLLICFCYVLRQESCHIALAGMELAMENRLTWNVEQSFQLIPERRGYQCFASDAHLIFFSLCMFFNFSQLVSCHNIEKNNINRITGFRYLA